MLLSFPEISKEIKAEADVRFNQVKARSQGLGDSATSGSDGLADSQVLLEVTAARLIKQWKTMRPKFQISKNDLLPNYCQVYMYRPHRAV